MTVSFKMLYYANEDIFPTPNTLNAGNTAQKDAPPLVNFLLIMSVEMWLSQTKPASSEHQASCQINDQQSSDMNGPR